MTRNHRGYRVGEAHQKARLSDEIVRHMRHLRRVKGLSYRAIGEAVGCSMWTARDIVTFATRPL